MGKSSKKPTIGYRYYVGMHMGLCHGPIDKITRILVDGRRAWSGESEGGQISISAETLFGDVEGGVSGLVDIEMGAADQVQNAYLVSQLGVDTPAFRGVTCAVLNQCYLGNNPYLKPWAFRAQRVYTTSEGATQWYEEKAGIPQDIDGPAAFYFLIDRSLSLSVPQFNIIRDAVRASLDLIEDFMAIAPNIRIDIAIRFYSNGSVGLEHTNVDAVKLAELREFIDDAVQVTGGDVDTAFSFIKNWFLASIDEQLDVRSVIFVTDSTTADTMPAASSEGGNAYEMINALDPFDDLERVDIYAINYISATTTYTELMDNTPVDGVPVISSTDATGLTDAVARGLASRLFDMNPAHIIRECLTDTAWGMGYSTSDIDAVSFAYAADILYGEKFGISLTWSAESPIIDFVNEILRYIDGTLYVDRVTGKFVLKLIRDDYAFTALTELNESNVVGVSGAKRPTIGDLVASVTVDYWNPLTGETASLTRHNQALFEIQTGGGGGTTVSYAGITSRVLASRVCLRDLAALSTPLLSCQIEVGRIAEELNIGDAFILDWPDLGINSLVMRVQQMSLGNIESNTIRIDALEDAFSLPSRATAGGGQTSLWTDPINQDVLAVTPRVVSELPYYELATFLSVAITDSVLADDPDAGFVFASGGRQSSEMNAEMHTDSGAGYTKVATMDFCPVAELAIDAGYTDAQIYYTGGVDMSSIVTGSVLQIGDELMRVDSLSSDSNGTFITVGRGVIDTTPAEHEAGVPIVCWGTDWSYDATQYTASDSVNVKLLSKRPSSTFLIGDAEADNVVLDSRAIRPYPPGNLQVDAVSYPTVIEFDYTNALTWAHRDRTQQTGTYLHDYTDTDIGPEAGTTYRIDTEAILANFNVVAMGSDTSATNSYTYTGADSNLSIAPSNTEFVRINVYSVRGGYESWQPASVVLPVLYDSSPTTGGKFLIESITNSTVGEFDFNSIPAGYARLIIEGTLRSDHNDIFNAVSLFFNADDNPANYYYQRMGVYNDTDDYTVEAAGPYIVVTPATDAPTNAYAQVSIIVEGYGNTSIIKGAVSNYTHQESSSLSVHIGAAVISHASMTAAITRLRFQEPDHPTHGLVGTLHLYGEY